MNRSPFIIGMAAVFAGLTTVLVAAAGATGSLFVLIVALPLGLTTAILWYHGTGRLAERMRARAARDRREAGRRSAAGPPPGGDGPFSGDGGRFGRRRRTAGARQRVGATAGHPGGATAAGGTGGGQQAGAIQWDDRMSTREAAKVLDVDPGADDGAIKRAYREKAKRLHPDVDGGDEAAFKEATEAYERLTGD